MLGQDQKEVWERLVGVLAMQDGSLLISETRITAFGVSLRSNTS